MSKRMRDMKRRRAASAEPVRIGGLVPVTSLASEPDATQLVELSSLRLDGGTQPRVSMDTDLVAEYAERMIWDEARNQLVDPQDKAWDAITVYRDDDGVCWLADGFHRVEAARTAGHARIQALVRDGGLEDAFVFSLGANAQHGKRRTNADKKRAVLQALRRASTQTRSNQWIAQLCQVSKPSVGKYRAQLEASGEIPFIEQLDSADGTLAPPRKIPAGYLVGEGGFLTPDPSIEAAPQDPGPGTAKKTSKERTKAGASVEFAGLEAFTARAIVAFPLSRVDCEHLIAAVSSGAAPELVVVPIEPDSPMVYEVPMALSGLVDDHGLTGPKPVYITEHDRFYFAWTSAKNDAGVMKNASELLGDLEPTFVGQPLGGWS